MSTFTMQDYAKANHMATYILTQYKDDKADRFWTQVRRRMDAKRGIEIKEVYETSPPVVDTLPFTPVDSVLVRAVQEFSERPTKIALSTEQIEKVLR